jgi:hypothetical protein
VRADHRLFERVRSLGRRVLGAEFEPQFGCALAGAVGKHRFEGREQVGSLRSVKRSVLPTPMRWS